KLMDLSEQVGEKVLEKGSDLMDRAAEAGAKLQDKAGDFIDKANEAAEAEKLEETIEQAKEAAAQAEARARAFDDKEGDRDTSDSLLDGTDSFFDRAARYADGDYHHEGSIRISESDEEKDKEAKPSDDITGFLDRDGDGDALIDDAEVEDDK
ncbi:MAG: hypothetical protein AAFY41_16470, partial [Bacteroidota bacterium]